MLLRYALLVTVISPPILAASESDDFFEQRVRPILAAKCLECHGESEPEGGLRLTSRVTLLTGGKHGPAAVAGEPQQSRLIAAIQQRGELKMPPDNRLRDDEIAVLIQWVKLGLPWPEAKSAGVRPSGMGVTDADRRHWAFQPIAVPHPPGVSDPTWPRSDIDRFILAKLDGAGLRPAPLADRRTLIRRAYFTLVGLPPSYDEIVTFEQDRSPDAFAHVVDRLLSSKEYGERWARHWLDVARFSDTKDGVLMYGDDRVRPYAYTYRDYVIRAFNDGTPFDRFIEEQLAADLIEPPVEPWRLGALGFLTLGRMYCNNVHDVIDDQIDTVSRGLLGLTVSCARCHDHKYDPLPTADYYSLYGVFASCETPLELPLVEPLSDQAEAVEFEKQASAKRDEIRKFLDEQFALLSEQARARVGDYLVHVVTQPVDPLETAIYFLSLAPDDLRPPIVARWRRLIAQRATPSDPVFGPWHDLMQLAAGLEGPDETASATFALGVSSVLAKWQQTPSGLASGQVNPQVMSALTSARLGGPADVARAYGDLLHRLYDESKAVSAGVSSGATATDPARQQLLDFVVSHDSPAYFPKIETRTYMSRQPKDAFGGKLQELDKLAVKSPHAPGRAMTVADAATPFDPKILVRGNPSQPGPHVPRQFLEILSSSERTPFPHGSGRLDLARAIASPENPLTARVIVNRVWMHHFGEPLVTTPSDFGFRSTPPSHPELLDHLAQQFMTEGWSLKRLHRAILLSSTWQQASLVDVVASERGRSVDPDNRLLWRMNRRRLDWEAMRDSLLAVSGRLKSRGPGRPVDIVGDPTSTVRTVYGMVDRQSLPNVFRVFDFASPDQSAERRPRTMVPQQALFAMNSPFVLEQTRALASRPEIAGESEASNRASALFRRVLGRDPTDDELRTALEFIAAPKEDESKLSVWEQLAQVLLSSNELMYVD